MDKHRGAVDFYFPNGAFRALTATEPLQLFRLFECELPCNKNTILDVPHGMKLLLLCVWGEGEVVCENTTFCLKSDSVLVCAEKTYELIAVAPQIKSIFLCLFFDASGHPMLHTTAELSPLLQYFSNVDSAVVSENAAELRRCCLELLSELSIPDPTMLLVKGSFYQVMVEAYRQFVRHSVSPRSDNAEMNAVGQTVYAIVRYIEENLFSINNLMDMAKELGYSYNYLSHLFRRKTGMTIQAYVTQKKIEQSTKLLADEQYSITEIASMLNYDCIQSFSKAFRRAMGISPTEYRTRIKR